MTVTPPELSCAPAQEVLWWVQHRSARKDVYNLTWRLTVAGLETEPLTHAWRLVTARHEALRTSFARRGDSLVRQVHPASVARSLVDVNEASWPDPLPAEPEALLDELATLLHAEPFDLARAPLARLTLLNVAGRQELLVTVHHAVLDGWALHLVLSDLDEAHRAVRSALAAGTDPDGLTPERVFAEPPVPYADFAERAGRPVSPDSLAYWRAALSGARAAALLPDGPPRPGRDGAVVRHRLTAAASAAVPTVAHRVGSTHFAVLLGAVRAVLAAGGATGRTGIGVVVANRMSAADQSVVGYCAHNVVLADAVAPGDTLDAVAGRARDALWESLPHQHVGFDRVVDELPAADAEALGAMPPVLITHHGRIGGGLALGGAPARLLPSPSSTARCQLVIGVSEEDADTVVEIEYDAATLSEATVRAFLADVEETLTRSAEAPDTAVHAIGVRTRATAGAGVGARPSADAEPAARPAAATAEQAGQPAAELLEFWRATLGVPASADDDFFQLGGHSLQVLSLIDTVEGHTGRRLDVTEWLDRPTPRRMAELLGLRAAAPANPTA
ncbi:hypothetical protein EBN88_12515, partial [Streptomyces triticirhizae]